MSVKDPETKEKISVYNALRKGDLDKIKRVYEIKKGDISIFNEKYGGLYPYDWAFRRLYYNLIEYFISIKIEPKFDNNSFFKIYSDDVKNNTGIIDKLLTIPNINILSVYWESLKPQKFRKDLFIKIMNHSATRYVYYNKNFGYNKKCVDCGKNDISIYYPIYNSNCYYNLNEKESFWMQLMNIDEDMFKILEELNYNFNPLKILELLSNINKYINNSWYKPFPFSKIMMSSLVNLIKSSELTEEDNIIFNNSMYKLLNCYYKNTPKLKILIDLYGDKYDFNCKLDIYIPNNKISLIEKMVYKNELKSLKLLLKYNGGVIKSNKLFYYLLKKNFNIYSFKNLTKNISMFNFLNDNYQDTLFCEDNENWNFDYNIYDTYCYSYDIINYSFSSEIKNTFKLISEQCKNEKFLQMISFLYHPFIDKSININDKIKDSLKFCFTNITQNVNYIEKIIIDYQDLIITKSNKRIYFIYNNILKYIKLYQECGYIFSETFLNHPNFSKIDQLKKEIEDIISVE
jgi:hypothetical protein